MSSLIFSKPQIAQYKLLANRKIINQIVSGKELIKHNTICTTPLRPNYAATATLPIPVNIDVAESTRFSPHRSRDISSSQQHAFGSQFIDITADNTNTVYGGASNNRNDPHVQSYDCTGAVSLCASMQSNVPTPFEGQKFSHLNMPGGQWSQEGKFTSQNLHNSHYTALRNSVRSSWSNYNQDATLISNKNVHATNPWIHLATRHYYSTKANDSKASSEEEQQPQQVVSKKDQLKKAFKDYGVTIVAFHITMSLASLGTCYLLVSGGVDVMPILDYLGLTSSALSNKLAAGASTFVLAYAIHKVFAPVRISITLGAAPFIVKYLRSKGFLLKKATSNKKL